MRNGQDADFGSFYLINNAKREFSEEVALPLALKRSTQLRAGLQ
jgi:hypothetical protein